MPEIAQGFPPEANSGGIFLSTGGCREQTCILVYENESEGPS